MIFWLGGVLFLLFFGLYLYYERSKQHEVKNVYDKNESDYVILFGSETGHAHYYAKTFYEVILNAGKKVYIAPLNSYELYEKVSCLIIFTATTGEGEPPANASEFLKLLYTVKQKQKVDYCVLGFGDKRFVNYCGFASDLSQILKEKTSFVQILELHKVDNRSYSDIEEWVGNWNNKMGLSIYLEEKMK